MTLTEVLDRIEAALPELEARCRADGTDAAGAIAALDSVSAMGPSRGAVEGLLDVLITTPQTPPDLIEALLGTEDHLKALSGPEESIALGRFVELLGIVRNAFLQAPASPPPPPKAPDGPAPVAEGPTQ